MGRIRLTAILTASAVAAGTMTPPSALAAPVTTIERSAHGALLCKVAPSPDDITVGESLEAAYRTTIQAAARAALAKYPNAIALKAAGYNEADIAVILVAADNPANIVADSTESLLPTVRASLSRSITQQSNAATSAAAGKQRAPLLSTGANFSTNFKADLRAAESTHRLQASIDAFEAQSGYAVMADAWQTCVDDLRAAGATEGNTPLPDIEYTVPAPAQGGSSGSSAGGIDPTTGVAVGVVALLIAAGVGYAVFNSGGLAAFTNNIGGNSQPILRLRTPGF